MIHILHILYKMDRAGTETWLMHVLRSIDRSEFQMDFLVHDLSPGAYDEEVRSLGGRIIPMPASLEVLYPWKFHQLLKEFGPYQIIHNHLPRAGIYHFLAALNGIKVRIAHNHAEELLRRKSPSKSAVIKISDLFVKHFATAGLAPSEIAAVSRYGRDWSKDPRWQILYYGIDLGPYEEEISGEAVRKEFNIPADALVIGHVGRFALQKNHKLIMQVAKQISLMEPNFRLFLVGHGPLKSEIEHSAEALGIRDRVIFTGPRGDVPRLMKGAMDVFFFPSHCETLGIVLVEAQAAGVPCVVSDTIPYEAEVIEPLYQRLSLKDPIEKWVEAILQFRDLKRNFNHLKGLQILKESDFNIENSCKKLVALYTNQLEGN